MQDADAQGDDSRNRYFHPQCLEAELARLTLIVQYLLLVSQYLQGTQRSVQTWTAHGLAVKAALSIGLHSREAMARFAPVEQEMRKRTWFGCVLLDRYFSFP